MKKIRVGIIHRSVYSGDAIGNDILGSYLLIEKLGFKPEIVCEFLDSEISPSFQTNINLMPGRIAKAYDLLIYHHSVDWPDGERIINAFPGALVVKYHNITPSAFFSPYAPNYEVTCRDGREQTLRFAQNKRVTLWQSDSTFNAQELAAAGVAASINTVVPPFNRTNKLMNSCGRPAFSQCQPIDLLFVGRLVPNKGHRHLLQMMSAYLNLFSTKIKLSIVGRADRQLARYNDELMALSQKLGVADHVVWLSHISNQELDDLFQNSHLYVNASEHEGFCVPIIEAQAIGLPVISVDSSALRETMGSNQIYCPLPIIEEDYEVMAGLVYEVVTNSTLRENMIQHGFKNVYDRFSQESIENQFVGSLEPVLRKFS